MRSGSRKPLRPPLGSWEEKREANGGRTAFSQLSALPLGSLNWLLRDDNATQRFYGTSGLSAPLGRDPSAWRGHAAEIPCLLKIASFLTDAERAAVLPVSVSMRTALAPRKGGAVPSPGAPSHARRRNQLPLAAARSTTGPVPLRPPGIGLRTSSSGDRRTKPRNPSAPVFWLSTDLQDDLGPGGRRRLAFRTHGFGERAFRYGNGTTDESDELLWTERLCWGLSEWQMAVPALLLACAAFAGVTGLLLSAQAARVAYGVAAALGGAAVAAWIVIKALQNRRGDSVGFASDGRAWEHEEAQLHRPALI